MLGITKRKRHDAITKHSLAITPVISMKTQQILFFPCKIDANIREVCAQNVLYYIALLEKKRQGKTKK